MESNNQMPGRVIWEQFYDELRDNLNLSQEQQIDTIDSIKVCHRLCIDALTKLKDDIVTHPLSSVREEIYFFKEVKPKFQSLLIYYGKLWHIETRLPAGCKTIQREYLTKQLAKQKSLFEAYGDVYQYYRSGETFLDEKYFLRNKIPSTAPLYFIYGDADPVFSTGYDYVIAKLKAAEQLCRFLEQKLEPSHLSNTLQESKPVLTWTASRVALAELIYALHASGVFNYSQAEVKQITDYFSVIFNFKIGNIYKVFEEIRIRQKNRTSFIDSLKKNLNQRMEDDDENA